MMNNLFNSPMAIMVPCSLDLNGSDISSIHYATVHDYVACMPSITININLNFKAFGGEVYPMDINITSAHQPGVQVMSCGRVVQNSNGSLPSDLCTNISYQMSAANNAVNDISAETAVYVLYAREAGVPIAVPYGSFELSFSLPESIPSLYRDPIFLSLTSGTSDGTITWLPRTTPKQLRKVYNALLQNLGTSNGTITAVAPLGTYYDMSPFDLAIANGALLGVNLTNEDLNVLNLTSGPSVFVENDPRQCYKGPGTVYTGAQVEASLDIQMITQFGEGSGTAFGFAATLNSSYFQYGDYSEGERVASQNYLNQLLLGLKPMPHVLSISYGGLPLASNSSLDRGNNTLAAYDATLAKFAAIGVTVLAASGDAGKMIQALMVVKVCPPYVMRVTSVGATMEVKTAPDAKAVFCASMAAAGGTITSGGGFGNISQHGSPVPSWQQAVVHKYINSHKHLPSWPLQPKLNPSAHYNVKCSKKSNGSTKGCVYGRAFPDISLIGTNVPIVFSGVPLLVSGTSVTSPAMAGLVAQLNAYIRATPGLEDKTIGFMNPFLYWAARYYPDAFTDIIHGNNFVYDSNWTKCALGYETAVGWDPVTGLGMPRMSVLQKAAVKYIQLQTKH
ncbi:hypothetical protein CEUSTIGMA_g2153.t1 [Chlamydomonas eustigma]|uniref:Peptidase S53 domain-containing protein n=1 Tax=Chlamydomonas eustigma TaxID=1157962 RepID=A0A250WV75_9CHLO|nr:hypothetical protein CEUSTIGMA_g2153.t1 [Chlamydomonas eustigma]|eukprot:GAX74705.1 hypothetical protein CEUSTIGMA_g2153.t1 [Chlamydomonas eustigma]